MVIGIPRVLVHRLRASALAGTTTPLERSRLLVLAVLVALTATTWALSVYQVRTMDMPMGVVVRGANDGTSMDMRGMASSGMAGMSAHAWSADTLLAFLIAWTVMMAAMMFPAAAPMLLLFHTTSVKRHGSSVPTSIFTAAYLAVWTGIGVVAWAAVEIGSDLAGRLGAGDRATWAPIALGTTLAAAGLYQLTPLKRVCLDHCRSPLNFMMQHWCEGRLGAWRMGLRHGLYCLGCCWALFAVLVAAGVMSLAWMALLTLVIFVEKVLPVGPRASMAIGALLVLLAVLVAVGVTPMPWPA